MMVKGTFWKFFKKITTLQGKTFKDFLEDLARFIPFVLIFSFSIFSKNI
jgi:hypothetical protein